MKMQGKPFTPPKSREAKANYLLNERLHLNLKAEPVQSVHTMKRAKRRIPMALPCKTVSFKPSFTATWEKTLRFKNHRLSLSWPVPRQAQLGYILF